MNFILLIFFILLHLIHCDALFQKSGASLRYLETNAWLLNIGKFEIAIDPVLFSPLDFGIPILYTGKKRVIDGKKELERICKTTDYVLLSQGLDDHAHRPTLKELARRRPNMLYIAPPSALSALKSCGISEEYITFIKPGQKISFTKEDEKIDISATTGALVGPPWQPTENGYVIFSNKPKLSLYYEPHCMFDPIELSQYQVDYIISPVIAQELPFFTLVAGGSKVFRLAEALKCKKIIPMANGNLDQSGLLASLVRAEGTEKEFIESASKAKLGIQVLSVSPGLPVFL